MPEFSKFSSVSNYLAILGVQVELDFVRFAAAVIVFISHAGSQPVSGGLFWQVGMLSQEAVLVFFVLSGFVISYTVSARAGSAKAYFISRASRVYSVAIPALVLTFAADTLGSLLRPALYAALSDYSADHRPWQLLNGLLFTSQIWSNHMRIGTNFPYWSIGFEVWYYLAFGIALFLPKRWSLPATAVVLAIAGPKISVLFPIWLMGVGAYWICIHQPLSRRLGALLWVGSASLFAICKWHAQSPSTLYEQFSVTPRHVADYSYYYLLGVLFAANLVGFHSMTLSVERVPRWLMRWLSWLGARTFSLYLFHMPLLFLVAAITPWSPAAVQTRLLMFLGVPALTFMLSGLTERRREVWRGVFSTLWESGSRVRLVGS